MLDKGFHSGSVAWQIHDHENEVIAKHSREVEEAWAEFVAWGKGVCNATG